MTARRPEVEAALAETARVLRSVQKTADGPAWYAGEFEMTILRPTPLADFNFLSGYALLHLARARALLGQDAPSELSAMLDTARDLAQRYRSKDGTLNWYSGKATGDRTPAFFDWGKAPILSIRNDLDDTAIAALLTSQDPAFGCPAIACRFPVSGPRTPLRENSKARLRAAGAGDGVYLSWVLPEGVGPPTSAGPRIEVPWENSVELVTVAHILAAVGARGDAAARASSRGFVNRLLSQGLDALKAGDPKPLAAAARYYPRVPFAPVGYVLRAHGLTDGGLLDDATLDRIEVALHSVDPETRCASDAFAASLYYLWAAANLAHQGRRNILPRAFDLAAHLMGQIQGGAWPDVIFFHDAHVGDYSGRPHAAALVCEVIALLIAAERA